jgi:hypothetical protein
VDHPQRDLRHDHDCDDHDDDDDDLVAREVFGVALLGRRGDKRRLLRPLAALDMVG